VPTEITGDDYAKLVSMALALSAERHCPVCDARRWDSVYVPFDLLYGGSYSRDSAASAVPVACRECGYIMLFLVAYLHRRAAALEDDGNGRN